MSALPIPAGLAWPECLECRQPVTERQQAAQQYQLIAGAGLVHRKCLAVAMVAIERQMVRS